MSVSPLSAPYTAEQLLLVDDDVVFRTRLGRALRDRGLQVAEASTAEEVCSQLSLGFLPHKVVLDLRLQQESGLDVLSCILQRAPAAKVLLLTGYGTIASAVEALRLGAINYLTKPVDPDSLLAAFSSTTATSSAPVQATSTPELAQVEWDHIQRVLQDCGGNVTLAAKSLGIHRRSLQRKLQKQPAKLR
jgi:two-component system response regulator RegA